MKKVKKIEINGETWEVRWRKRLGPLGNYLGLCWHSERVIEISTDQPVDELINTITHEITHAANPQLTEEEVCDTADAISSALWSMGLRIKK